MEKALDYQTHQKNAQGKKRFSIKKRMLLALGSLMITSLSLLCVLAIKQARHAVMERVNAQLQDKAEETALVLETYMEKYWKYLEGISELPQLKDPKLTYFDKAAILMKIVKASDFLKKLEITDTDGLWYLANGKTFDCSKQDWYIDSKRGTLHTFSAPMVDLDTKTMIITISVPIYAADGSVASILLGVLDGYILCNAVDNIPIGKTGNAYIISENDITVADKDRTIIERQWTPFEAAKTDPSFKDCAEFEKSVLEAEKSGIGSYIYDDVVKIAGYAKMSNGWAVIVCVPPDEMLDAVYSLRTRMILISFAILLFVLVIVFVVSTAIGKKIGNATSVLYDIAQGEGDLTVRLPVNGNDEITDMAEYFNETIAKIGSAIKSIGGNAGTMQEIGADLSSNMTETASSVNQISANIEGVKEQTMTQAASITETSATMEEIIRTIQALNGSIESQATSVAQSSASIEQMVANIASVTQNLNKADAAVQHLVTATSDGKETVSDASVVTQKIAEESGSLIEASNVIQNIASQTNLLAMNAAIEAAHAGDAGKGFAVVADEIRKLAEESATQGKAITGTLKNLSVEIQEVADSAKLVGEKFTVIFDFSEQVRQTSALLSAAMQEQENGSREVLTAIKDINSVTQEVKSGSEEMLKGGEQVAEEMRKLDTLTRVITESMNEMASGAVQINNAVQEVNEITQRNKQAIDNLAAEVGKFKV